MKNKVLICIPVYLENDLHNEFTLNTLKSIESSITWMFDYEFFIVENHTSTTNFKKSRKVLGKYMPYVRMNLIKRSVSSAWNGAIMLEKEVRKYDYILFCNNDILVKDDAIENLILFAKNRDDFIMWSGAEWKPDNPRGDIQAKLNNTKLNESIGENPHFSFFMIDKYFYEKMYEVEKDTGEPFPGLFDENIKPAYLEDNDMHQRIIRNGYKAGITTASLFYHYGSRTINSDDSLKKRNSRTQSLNHEYFERKWGFNIERHNGGKGVPNDDPVRTLYNKPFNN